MKRTWLALSAVVALGSTYPAYAQDKKPDSIVINDSGGAYDETLRAAVWSEYEKRYGVKITVTSPNDFGKLRAMVESGNPTWDLTEVEGQEAIRVVEMGLAERIDDKVVDRGKFVKDAQDPYVFGATVYSTVLGFRPDAFPNGAPKTWQDFWDVKKFPGPRALYDGPVDNLEFALLADGVPADKLYPLDLDRAFKKLDEIYPSVSVWWKTGQQPVQLLTDKEVVLSSGWSTRFYNAVRKGAPIALSWEGGIMAQGGWIIPKGAKNKEYAQKVFAVMSDPKVQANTSIAIGSSGTNVEANNHVPDDVRKLLPLAPENMAKQVWLNEQWWAKNGAAVERRWNEWKLKKG